MSDIHKPRIDFSQIGQADLNNLASTFLDAAKRFYEDPANIERFEKWRAEREKEASNGKVSKRRG